MNLTTEVTVDHLYIGTPRRRFGVHQDQPMLRISRHDGSMSLLFDRTRRLPANWTF